MNRRVGGVDRRHYRLSRGEPADCGVAHALHCERACNFARIVPAHAVGDDEHVGLCCESIFVGLAQHSDMRRRTPHELHHATVGLVVVTKSRRSP